MEAATHSTDKPCLLITTWYKTVLDGIDFRAASLGWSAMAEKPEIPQPRATPWENGKNKI